MLTLTQATELLAITYEVSPNELQKTRQELGRMGLLPLASGRDIPQANPQRMAVLFMALTGARPDRIGELLDLRRYDEQPGDSDDATTLAEVLGFSFMGLMNNPEEGLDLHLNASLSGDLRVTMTHGAKTCMTFGEPGAQGGYIRLTGSVSMMPLALFCDAARALQPPYKVSR
ncbi:hypothetical protein [uncultured Tateyamaria sp.]|uniref:hypothetical protein n=1 Tax=uncultured Tateyamaria sp. TaxID=455651 RepID=UPI0026283DA5|nr:hypothetical protein [uncultured Tateyamaria sp.]